MSIVSVWVWTIQTTMFEWVYHNPQFVVHRGRWGRGSVMVFGGISAPQRTELDVVQGKYKCHELSGCYSGTHCRDLGYQNVTWVHSHGRHCSSPRGQDRQNRMEWPALSPDLNPIENTWTILGNNVRNHESSVSTDELIIALQDEWINFRPVVLRFRPWGSIVMIVWDLDGQLPVIRVHLVLTFAWIDHFWPHLSFLTTSSCENTFCTFYSIIHPMKIVHKLMKIWTHDGDYTVKD